MEQNNESCLLIKYLYAGREYAGDFDFSDGYKKFQADAAQKS